MHRLMAVIPFLSVVTRYTLYFIVSYPWTYRYWTSCSFYL